MKTIGLALGSGGARGLAHLAVLEALADMGLRAQRVSGASVGAVVGALYASGIPPRQIRRDVLTLLGENGHSGEGFLSRDYSQLLSLIDPNFGISGLIKGDRFLEQLARLMQVTQFEELEIPLEVVATDFWKREQVVLDSGDVLPAVRASMALPGIFTPVTMGERVLIDGGAVNPVPFDLLMDDCDIVIAVDVMGRRSPGKDPEPDFLEAVFNTFQIMQHSIVREKLRLAQPHILLNMQVPGVKVLEFYKAEEILAAAKPEVERLRTELERLL
ncbi:patatin-like phospholipase family protein [Desulfovibrio ferrophilus]|uniref:Patatin n=1 Tax=Desulfovibrio ferrophilus TaxID=241368 RepID=A0A2Z6B200_9BACT|nr:patatin-like phospholipase family protein [Desulfovibrio ferrophilus]BBD09524.1 patatin [Desulfovibrio ferrophilus]